MAGFIGIDRGIEEHWIYQDAEYFKVWFEILLRTRYSTEPEKKLIEGKFVTIEYAHFIFGRISWSDRLKVSERRIRTLFDKLIQDGMIRVVSKYPKFTIYHVLNFSKYRPIFDHHSDQQNDQQQGCMGQGISDICDQQNDSAATSNRPAADQQPTTQEQGSNKGNKVNNKTLKEYTPEFSEFWDAYPRKVSKSVAYTKWKTIIKTESFDYIMQCTRNYAKEVEIKQTAEEFIKHPSTFLEKERYKDYYLLVIGGGNRDQGRPNVRSGGNQTKGRTESDDEFDDITLGVYPSKVQ